MSTKRRKQLRLAQAQYRRAHARKLVLARQVTNVLLRQKDRINDVERLAAALEKTLSPAAIIALRAVLRQR
jgi:hypothetical protein